MLLRSKRLVTKIDTKKNIVTNDLEKCEKTPYSISEFSSKFFDESSVAWKINKIQKMNATYEYRCAFYYSNKKRCCELPFEQLYCKKHMK